MNKNIFIIGLLALNFIYSSSYAQDWEWANAIVSNTDNVSVNHSVVDSEKNIYIFGEYDNSILNITDGTPVNSDGNSDLFIAKYDESGNPIWMRFIHSAGDVIANSIAIDANDNIYVLNTFLANDCKYLAPNVTPDITIANTGIYDIGMAKYTKDGDLSWAINAAWGVHINWGGAIYVDNVLGRVLFTGWFINENKFDDGEIPETIIPDVVKGGFIAYTDLDGNYLNHSHISLPTGGGDVIISDISKYNNSYYFSGNYKDQVQLETNLLTAEGAYDVFIYKTNENLIEETNQTIHGSNNDYGSGMDANENGVYLTAMSLSPSITIEGTTPSNHTLSGDRDFLTVKFDYNLEPTANAIYPSTGDDYVYSHSLSSNRLIISGQFKDSLLIPNTDTLITTTSGFNDAFFLVSDQDLNPLYASSLYGTANDKSISSTFISENELLLSGTYESDPFIFPSQYGNEDTLHVSVGSNGFAAKYRLCGDYDIRFIVDSTSCPSSSDGELTAIVCKDQTIGADTIEYTWDYLWSNTLTTDTIKNLPNGVYSVTMTNRYGCEYMNSVNLTNDPILTVDLTDTVTLNCFYDTYPTDTVYATFGQRPYSYIWSSAFGTDSVITNAPVGIHYVTVTDACGTAIVDSIRVGHIPTLTSTISTHNTIIACAAGNDGEAWMNTNNGYSTITYAWENSTSTGYIASDLAIGLHHVTVTDGCISIVDSVNVVNLPSMNAQISSSTNITCSGNTDGTADLFVVGGVQPYSFNWSSTETVENAVLLPEGWAFVTVSDACGSVIDSVEIGLTPSMTLQLSANHETCSGGNGEVIVVASNGSGAYTFEWDTLPSAGAPISINDTVNNLSANTYYVTVSDNCGSVNDSIVLTVNPTLEATLSSHALILNCDSSTNGSIAISASNGVPPYNFTWSSSSSTNNVANDLSVGVEHVTITDQCGTIIEDSISIGYMAQLIAFTEHMSDASCSNTNDGKASVLATGGVPPYTFTWSNSISTSNISTDLPVGLQYVTVSDYCGNVIDSVEIVSLPALSFTLTASGIQCPNDSLGYITATAANGVAPYTYDWGTSSNLDTNYIDSLWADMHYVTITDLCNQPIEDSIEIISSTPITAALEDNTDNILCQSGTTGEGTMIASNGVSPYTYLWSNGEIDYMVQNLEVGLHYVSVYDMCNDTIVDSIFVSHLPTMMVDITSSNPLCFNDTNGIIELEVTQGIQPYIIIWETINNTDLSQDSLPSGTYKFSVVDQCATYSDSVILTNPDSILIAANITDESQSGLYDGAIILMASGGTTPYQYSWSNGETSQDLVSITSGTYTITILDFNKCSSTNSFEVKTKVETIEPVDAFTPNGDGVNETWAIQNIDKFPDCEIKIFNQWGNLVFESTGYDEPWDGTSNGKQLASAVYYYIIDLKDDSDAQSGSITLIR